MALYFYLIHPFLPDVVALQVPLYLSAPDIDSAKRDAQALLAAFRTQFAILFDPSDPVLVVPSVNQARFDALIATTKTQPNVTINLPVAAAFSCFQHAPHTSPLATLEARVLVSGTHASIYSL